jgi:hypothetical protein
LHQALAFVCGGHRVLFAGRDIKIAVGKALLLLWGVLCLGGLTACDSKQTADIGNSKEMIAALNEKVPKGTPVATAKAFMESELFQVEDLKKGKWKGKSDVTFLKCTRKDGSPPIFRQWEVALINDGKVVTSIEARTALLYP